MENVVDPGRLASALAHLEAGVRGLDPADLLASDQREQARTRLANALAEVLAMERADEGHPEERRQARALIQSLLRFVDARAEVAELIRGRQLAHRHQEALQQATTGDLPLELDLRSSGPPEAQQDWWSLAPLGPRTLAGVFGSVDEGDPGSVVATLQGALAVARRGIGTRLATERVHTVLHAALGDVFGERPVCSTALSFQIDLTSLRLTVSSAGHRPLWHVRDGVFQSIRTHAGSPLGVHPVRPGRPVSLTLRPGDVVVGFTAGTLHTPTGSVRESDLRIALVKGLSDGRSSGAAVLEHALSRQGGSSDRLSRSTVFSIRLT